MLARIDVSHASPEAFKAMRELQMYVNGCGLEPPLMELVKLRASQINGCAFCVGMHSRDARASGESQERLDLVSVWPEAPVFTPRERAALAWTQAVTLVAAGRMPDMVYEEARRNFSEKELADLTLAIIAINGWNRFNVAFRRPPEVASSVEAA